MSSEIDTREVLTYQTRQKETKNANGERIMETVPVWYDINIPEDVKEKIAEAKRVLSDVRGEIVRSLKATYRVPHGYTLAVSSKWGKYSFAVVEGDGKPDNGPVFHFQFPSSK